MKNPLDPGELRIGVSMCNYQLTISLNKPSGSFINLCQKKKIRASGNEIHRGGSSL